MRFLVDATLSPRVAAENGLVIVSADTDFGELLALSRGAIRPSAVLLRSADRLTPDQQAALLAANLPAAADELKAGALVTIARGRVRIRSLPILGNWMACRRRDHLRGRSVALAPALCPPGEWPRP